MRNHIEVYKVYGFQAQLMWAAYAGAAVAAFSYGYARYHSFLAYYYEAMLAFSLFVTAVTTMWSSLLPLI